jgi:outer membrane lipoprotein carrier protein
MRRTLLGVLTGAWLVCAAPRVFAADTVLEQYLKGLTTLRASFTQHVVDGQGKETESGEGTLLVEHPGRFSWDYRPQGQGSQSAGSQGASAGQLMLADGKNLWFYDRDLAQVTVKPAAAALSATPIMLLSGDLSQLRTTFTLLPLPEKDKLQWVRVTPLKADAEFSRAELGFAGDELQRMVITDRLGQNVTLEFSQSKRNAKIAAGELSFKPPAGVDVIGKPVATP